MTHSIQQWQANLNECFDRAPKAVRESGLVWYEQAHDFAALLAKSFKISHDVSAQVISALSPAARWEKNKDDAANLVEAYYKRGLIGCKGVTCTTYGKNKLKAINILLGNTQFSDKQGLKTYNFYKNILSPNCADYVTIDRHAFAMLQGKAQGAVKLNVKTYCEAATLFKNAAKDCKLLPCQLQAIVWLQWKNEQRV